MPPEPVYNSGHRLRASADPAYPQGSTTTTTFSYSSNLVMMSEPLDLQKGFLVSETVQKPLLSALNGQVIDPPPVWLMRQAGRYLPEYRALRAGLPDFLSLCYSPEDATEATLQPIRRFGLDGAILFSDILVVAQALGASLAFHEGEGPVLSPIRDETALSRLDPETALSRLTPVLDTVKRLKGALPTPVTLLGFAGAPWTVACYMVEGKGTKDFEQARRLAVTDPALFGRLIDKLVEATDAYLSAQIEAGADAVQIFDSWAGLLPEDAFRRWVIDPTAKLVRSLRKKHPGVPIIGFPKGAGANLGSYHRGVESEAIGIDFATPLSWARRELGNEVVLQGNLDPMLLLAGGEALDQAVDSIRQDMRGGRFIFNLGHGVLPKTPPEHVARLLGRLRA